MARKIHSPTPPPTPPTIEPARAQLSIINLKGTEAYRQWVAEYSRDTHIPTATLFRLGMIELAKKHGRKAPPDK